MTNDPHLCAICGEHANEHPISHHEFTPRQPKDRYRKAETPPDLLPCRFCGSSSELWQRWEVGDIWYSFGACTNLEDVDGEPCHFHLPDSVAFYKPRKVEAVRYWNLMMGPREALTALEQSAK